MRFLEFCFLALSSVALSSFAAPAVSTSVEFHFREPAAVHYRVEEKNLSRGGQWLEAIDGVHARVEIGSRVVLQLKNADDLKRFVAGTNLKLSRAVAPNVFILQAPDAATAAGEAHRLAASPEIISAVPVMRRDYVLHGSYAGKPNDPYFDYRGTPPFSQWHLENRNSNGVPAGADINARAAWPLSRGDGVAVAVVDDGIELSHPDLISRVAGMPHFNFYEGTTNMTLASGDVHATAVAGLIAAELNNGIGVAGVAPGAKLASWKMFLGSSSTITDEQLMDLFQYCSNSVAVQNHSWGIGGGLQIAAGVLPSIGVSNAIQFGRNGLGVVMVRSAGNERANGNNADDEGFLTDPRVIAVGAVNIAGRVANYSNPGACLLVVAPGGEQDNINTLVTTDRQGTNGINFLTYSNEPAIADYCWRGSGFVGTSGAAPQVAGIAALMLSVNPGLSYRDVQQILIHSARHFDLADPDLATNGAGFRVSHNQGFGVPDAGFAVALAQQWNNRPPATNITLIAANTFTTNNPGAILDDGLRVVVSDGATNVMSIPASPDLGLTINSPTAFLPLIDVGQALTPILQNLTNKGALIQRGNNSFTQKIQFAADAGAAFAVVYNNSGTSERVVMGTTDFSPIPAVFIGKTNGDALHNLLLTNSGATAQLNLFSTNYTFVVTNTLSCEHVAVRLQTDHTRRADVRITLISPTGTRSVLDKLNNDTTHAGPVDWTYSSTHHFYESSYGAWTVCVSDEAAGATGSVTFASVTIEGVPINDSDHDGLDDGWETANFGSLGFGPKDDPDKDGYNNMREFILGTNPNAGAAPFAFQLDLSRWRTNLARLSWPGSSNFSYEIRAGTNPAALSPITNLTGQFPVTEYFPGLTNSASTFFQVRAVANP